MSKTKARTVIAFIGVLSVMAGVQASSIVANQVTADTNTTFQVNVVESLSVSITAPTEWARGGIGTFLRNKVGIEVSSNSTGGFTASMYSKNSTNLTNTTSGNAELLPTLGGSTVRSSFPANHWGYSLGEYALDGVNQSSYTLNGNSYGEIEAGNNGSNYYPLVSTSASPITIMDGSSTAKKTGSQNIYFGSKADASQASGTYSGTVVISVVTGEIDSTNPITPQNPATDNAGSNNPSYATNYGTSGNEGWTTYTTTSTDSTAGTTTTTTEVSDGDTRNSYQNPAGVIENTYANISDNAPLATGLAVTAAVAATSGYMFFIVANRREREDEEEEEVS